MKECLVLILLYCTIDFNVADWVLEWEDNFDYKGHVNSTKWDFNVGGSGWGLLFTSFYFFVESFLVNIGNNEAQYYTNNRLENARCELFPGSHQNGRLIIEARKVRLYWPRFSSHGESN